MVNDKMIKMTNDENEIWKMIRKMNDKNYEWKNTKDKNKNDKR